MVDKFIACAAVDEVDAEAGGPVGISGPAGFVESFYDEDEVADGPGDGGEPFVVGVGVGRVVGEEANDGAEGA